MKLLLLFLLLVQTYADEKCEEFTCTGLDHCIDADDDGYNECVFNPAHLYWIVPLIIIILIIWCIISAYWDNTINPWCKGLCAKSKKIPEENSTLISVQKNETGPGVIKF